jgi:predicted dinucleotide-binding enzyme
VARLAIAAGYDAVLSNSRGPQTLLENLARPAGAADRSALPIAGDDADAKIIVTQFLDAIGYEAVDPGPLAESWRQQPGTPVYGAPYGSMDDEKGTPAGADVIRAALAAATR